MMLYCSTCFSISGVATLTWQIDNYKADICSALPPFARIGVNIFTKGFCPQVSNNQSFFSNPLAILGSFGTGDRTFSPNEEQSEVIGTIISTAQELGATKDQIVVAIATCIVESRCTTGESVREKDHDSIGAFQQRPSQDWPNSEDTAVQTKAFFEGSGTNKGLFDVWRNSDSDDELGKMAQEVQRSAYPERYAQWIGVAREIYEKAMQGGGVATGDRAFPIAGKSVTDIMSPYGDNSAFRNGNVHRGVDYQCAIGTPWLATESGTIHYHDHDPNGWGKGAFYLVPDSDPNAIIIYGHGDRVAQDGQQVRAGEVVGTCNSHGFSTGPHLHLEVRPDGMNSTPIDPMPYVETLK